MADNDQKLKVIEGFTIVNFVLSLIVLILMAIIMFNLKKETTSFRGTVGDFANRLKSIGGTIGSAFADYYLS